MIVLDRVSLKPPRTLAPILNNVSVMFGPRERVAILAGPGQGKSSIARLLSGIEQPTSGTICTTDASWPLGYAGFLHPFLTIAQNLSSLAKLSGQNPTDFQGRVLHLSGLEPMLGRKLQDLAPTERSLLAYMISIVTPAKTMIADEKLTVGDRRTQSICEALLLSRLATDGLIFLTRNQRQAETYCHRFIALHRGRFIHCESAVMAHELLQENANA